MRGRGPGGARPPWWAQGGGRFRPDRPRPPWWPEGEAWPPQGGDWGAARRGFARRVGCFVGLGVLLLFGAGALASRLLGGWDDEGRGGGGPPFGLVFLVLLVLGALAVGRAVRRTAAPIGAVMEAADRVAGGDLGARVEAAAPGEVGRLVGSFNAMAARLEANEAQRRALLADVAHELRTPLAVVRGNVEGMLDGVYPRDDGHLGPVLEATATMARLLDDLRTLSTAEAGALRLHREPTGAAELVGQATGAFGPRAAEAGVALLAEVGEVPIPELDVDPVRIGEVLGNLTENALRHTPRGGAVRVRVWAEGGEAVFEVADTGPGIAAADLPRVFDRFWRSADSGGSGLGLAIARGLVEAHGGRIWAESEAGEGTTVRFAVPLG